MNIKIRFKAFAVHLLISALVVGAAMALTYGVWYRPPFAYAENVATITLLLIAVDLVMGPLLTLIVYNPQKKSLRFDLALIGLVQVAALVYGMSTIYRARPVYAVYHDGRFATATASAFQPDELAKVGKDSPYLPLPRLAPQWIGARVPPTLSESERDEILTADVLGGGPRVMPRLYVPYATVAPYALQRGKRADRIDYARPQTRTGTNRMPPATRENLQELLAELKKIGRPLDQLVLVPLHGSERWAIVVIDAKDGRILDSVNMQPFWF